MSAGATRLAMLEIRGLCAGYGRSNVLHAIDLRVETGEIVALIGANGAGKSTLAKVVSGLVPASAGSLSFEGKAVAPLTPAQRVRAGLVHVPEGRQVFGGLSVADNLELGGYVLQAGAREIGAIRAQVCEIFPILADRLAEPASNLSGGQQQMLAIARGLMAKPRLLILDEPSLGLSPSMVTEVFRLIGVLRDKGVSILLSEQNAQQALAIADRGYVLESGRIALDGSAQALLGSREVAEKYLGIGVGALSRTGARSQLLADRLAEVLAR
jgi:branched-chain amino acid transport system ATP-binding protein